MYRKNKKRGSSGLYIKVIVLGDSGVGKTTFINRYTGGYYEDSFAPTIGLDFKIKRVDYQKDIVNLQIWDTAGQQKFKTLTKSYFQGCKGVVLAFSLTDRKSYENISNWIAKLSDIVSQDTPKVLVGTKVDCFGQRQISVEECSQLTLNYDLQYYEASSKTGYNIENIFESLVEKIMGRQSKVGHSRFQNEDQCMKQESLRGIRLSQIQKFKGNCEC